MKKIVKIFNNFIKRTIFKVENKTNDKFHVSNFSKYTIAVIVVLFIYIFYLLVPLLYDKNWVQNKIVTKLSDEFNINLSNSFDISYHILPKPHYLIKDSKTSLAEIKAQVLKLGYKEVSVASFKDHVSSHYVYEQWHLTTHKLVGFCYQGIGTPSDIINISIPGFNQVNVRPE